MDRSNLFIGAGVLVGLGTLAYWLLNREDGAAADRALTARRQKLIRAAAARRALTWGTSAKATTRASVVANPSDDVADIMRDDAF